MTIRIGVIGAGANTRTRHIPGFLAIPEVEVVAVCNRTPESGQRVAKEFNIPTVAPNWREVVEAPGIDAICVGTWPNMHAKLAVASLRQGKHVLTEARMARNSAEAEMMVEEARLHPKLVAQIVPAPMSLPFDSTITWMTQSGMLGPIREVIMTCTNDAFADSGAPRSWRQDTTLSGKNTLFLGIYYEMVLRWLGRGVTSVVATAAIYTKERKDEDGVPWPTTIPESVSVLGTFEDGARLIGHFSGVDRTGARNEIRINGSNAGVRLDLTRNELWLTKGKEKERLIDVPPERRGSWRVEADFIDSIREGKPVRLTDFETGAKYMHFTDAVWESWNNHGQRMTL